MKSQFLKSLTIRTERKEKRIIKIARSNTFALHLIAGPSFWGLINPQWSLCSKGRRQSPINIEPDKLLFDRHLRPVHVDKHKVIYPVFQSTEWRCNSWVSGAVLWDTRVLEKIETLAKGGANLKFYILEIDRALFLSFSSFKFQASFLIFPGEK